MRCQDCRHAAFGATLRAQITPGRKPHRLAHSPLMNIVPFTALSCPLDGQPLRRSGNTWRCAGDHCFDIASQGHTHLLPVQNKRSLDPGDSKEMVACRQRFLNAGHYRSIAEAMRRAVLQGTPENRTIACLDAGCGEGYYLRQLAAPGPGARPLALIGVDISKWAVLAAAKQDKRMAWVVGSNANLPLLPASVDRVLCMFGFPVYAEFARVLKPGGQLVQIDAGPAHLRELREIIYPVLKPEKESTPTSPPGFEHLSTERVAAEARLEGQAAIADLLAMTPHLHRASREGRERLAALSSLTVTIDVSLMRYRRA